jgi:hypothetical protein
MRETGLVGTRAASVDPAAFTTGHRGSVWQSRRRVTAVPADHQRIRRRSVLKAALQ